MTYIAQVGKVAHGLGDHIGRRRILGISDTLSVTCLTYLPDTDH